MYATNLHPPRYHIAESNIIKEETLMKAIAFISPESKVIKQRATLKQAI